MRYLRIVGGLCLGAVIVAASLYSFNQQRMKWPPDSPEFYGAFAGMLLFVVLGAWICKQALAGPTEQPNAPEPRRTRIRVGVRHNDDDTATD